MQLSYDPRHNIAYLKFHEKTAEVESVRLNESLVLDLAPNGTIYGIELLNANEQLRGRGTDRFIFTNEATGQQAEIVLP